jgi:hypothetical protein
MPLGHLRENAVQRITRRAFPASYLVSMRFLPLLRAHTTVVLKPAYAAVTPYLFANQRLAFAVCLCAGLQAARHHASNMSSSHFLILHCSC